MDELNHGDFPRYREFSFGPGFSARVMERLAPPRRWHPGNPETYRTLRGAFLRVAVIAAVAGAVFAALRTTRAPAGDELSFEDYFESIAYSQWEELK